MIPEPRPDAPDTSAVEHEWTRPSPEALLISSFIAMGAFALIWLWPPIVAVVLGVGTFCGGVYLVAIAITEWIDER